MRVSLNRQHGYSDDRYDPGGKITISGSPMTANNSSSASLTRRGAFKSVAELIAAIEAWIAERNANPKPFKWTAKANSILEKNARARRVLEQVKAGTK
jgi:hypothetical protein